MIRTSAPGSIMITGEHAVVYGSRAIVAAIEQRLTVTLTPRKDREVTISSQIADPLRTHLDELQTSGAYKFVLAAIAMHQSEMTFGFDLLISSEINPTLGLGSSAAVTIAVLGAISTFVGQSHESVHAKAYQIIQDIQGRGSGADLAASFQGGMIAYRAPEQTEIIPLAAPPELSLKYCGYKTPTAVVLQKIASQMQGNEAIFDALYAEMGVLADQAITAAQARDWQSFAEALTAYQTRMEALGVSDETLDGIITSARASDGLMATKISGSGLGDCVLALGTPPEDFTPVTLATKGLILHD